MGDPGPLSVIAALLAAAVYVFAVGTLAGRELDRSVLQESPSKLHDLFAAIVILVVYPVTVVLGGLAATRHARRTGGAWAATGSGIVLVGPVLAAHGPKVVLGGLDPLGGQGLRALGRAFVPSGHAAVGMTVALIAVRAADLRRRRVIALMASIAAGVYGSLIFTRVGHHAFDVAGGALLAVAWIAAAVALWPQLGVKRGPDEREEMTFDRAVVRDLALLLAAAVVLAGALTVGGALPWRPLLLSSVMLVTLTTLALTLVFERALVHTTPRLRPQAASG